MASIIIPAIMAGAQMYMQNRQQNKALAAERDNKVEQERREYALAKARWQTQVAAIKRRLATNPKLAAQATPEYLAALDKPMPEFVPGAWKNPAGNGLFAAGAAAAGTAGQRWPNPPNTPPPYRPPAQQSAPAPTAQTPLPEVDQWYDPNNA